MCMDIKAYENDIKIKTEAKRENGDKNKIEEYRQKARMSGCEMTDGQILYLIAELEKEFVLYDYLRERGLEFANERTRQSVAADFEKLIFNPENKDVDFKDMLHSIVTDKSGELIWDLFTAESGRKNRVAVFGADEAVNILPPCGNIDASEKNNPFEKESWNMAEQSRIYKENPEIAKYLAAAAKQKLF